MRKHIAMFLETYPSPFWVKNWKETRGRVRGDKAKRLKKFTYPSFTLLGRTELGFSVSFLQDFGGKTGGLVFMGRNSSCSLAVNSTTSVIGRSSTSVDKCKRLFRRHNFDCIVLSATSRYLKNDQRSSFFSRKKSWDKRSMSYSSSSTIIFPSQSHMFGERNIELCQRRRVCMKNVFGRCRL